MACRCRAGRTRCATTCQASGRTKSVRRRCRCLRTALCAQSGRSAKCRATRGSPTPCGGRAFEPTSPRTRAPASTSRAPRRSSRASCVSPRRTTTPQACCRTRWGGQATRTTAGTATGCLRPTRCSPRRSARTSTGSSGAARAAGARRVGWHSARSGASTTRAGWTPTSACARIA